MPTPLELDLAVALEHIEALLNKQPGAYVNEDETTRKIRGIIEDALKKAVDAGDRERGQPQKERH
jgi:hypothetical protein